MKKVIVILSLIMVIASIPACNKSTLPLQEKCSAGATKFVEDLKFEVANYTHHYNKKLDACLVRVDVRLCCPKNLTLLGCWAQSKELDAYLNYLRYCGEPDTHEYVHDIALYNVFENKKIGHCGDIITNFSRPGVTILCSINNKDIQFNEFENIIKQYMEE